MRPTIRFAAAATAKTSNRSSELAGAFNDAIARQGILSCGKHFPGYSAATVDAHHDLPKIDRTRERVGRGRAGVFREFAPSRRQHDDLPRLVSVL